MNQLKIGIIGIGFVGGAIKYSFDLKKINLVCYDKFKNIGSFGDVINSNLLFLALPTVYDNSLKTYNLDPLHEVLSLLKDNNYHNPIVIKSTVVPTTVDTLAVKYNLSLIHNPEFLTARTANENFHNQTHIILGKTSICNDINFNLANNFYKYHYPNANISLCTSNESESMKLFVNCFYSVKVQFFNELYLVCQSTGTDYNNVKNLMLKNGWINPMHTTVPGPDGQLSYGGLCFPKDTNALLNFMKSNNTLHQVLEATINERNQMRDDHDNVI